MTSALSPASESRVSVERDKCEYLKDNACCQNGSPCARNGDYSLCNIRRGYRISEEIVIPIAQRIANGETRI